MPVVLDLSANQSGEVDSCYGSGSRPNPQHLPLTCCLPAASAPPGYFPMLCSGRLWPCSSLGHRAQPQPGPVLMATAVPGLWSWEQSCHAAFTVTGLAWGEQAVGGKRYRFKLLAFSPPAPCHRFPHYSGGEQG